MMGAEVTEMVTRSVSLGSEYRFVLEVSPEEVFGGKNCTPVQMGALVEALLRTQPVMEVRVNRDHIWAEVLVPAGENHANILPRLRERCIALVKEAWEKAR
jgi:hypothetical protein